MRSRGARVSRVRLVKVDLRVAALRPVECRGISFSLRRQCEVSHTGSFAWMFILGERCNGCEDAMKARLIAALRESCGYMHDEGWHQTAQLMLLAGDEIERLNERIRQLEEHLRSLDDASDALRTPEASNQNATRVAAVSSLR